MKRATKEWVRKAEDDYRTAEFLALSSQPLHDQRCFHCQQAAEKYLQALLEELGLSIEKTHELEDLLDELLPHHRSLRSLRRGLAFRRISPWISVIPATTPPSAKLCPPCAGPARS